MPRVPVAMQFAGSSANPVDQLAGYKTPLCQDAEMILEMLLYLVRKKKEEITHRRDTSRLLI